MLRFILGLLIAAFASSALSAPKQLVIIAGRPSHGPLDHEFRAGALLLQRCLSGVPGLQVEVHTNGWVSDPSVLDRADAVLIYADGGGGHPGIQKDHLAVLASLAKRGAGIACAHFGVELPSTNGGPQFAEWIGGYYEHLYSVNPMWKPEFNSFPDHPITRGVKQFAVTDEWYFNIRWRKDMEGVTPILVAKPSDKVRGGPYVYPPGPYPHIQAASGRDEVMMWANVRPDGGRGFGFTGGHRHLNWGNENYRKTVLNALLWVSGLETPADGVRSDVTQDELMLNLDPKPGSKPPVKIAQPAPK
ncbi:MAG: ThuA domain-containing protein [Verrucomicrobia bacterium]|nr:ThuA domain-containing protein [Verrucomicrobiota bacterium]